MATKKTATAKKRKVITPKKLQASLRAKGLKLPHGYSIKKRKTK